MKARLTRIMRPNTPPTIGLTLYTDSFRERAVILLCKQFIDQHGGEALLKAIADYQLKQAATRTGRQHDLS